MQARGLPSKNNRVLKHTPTPQQYGGEDPAYSKDMVSSFSSKDWNEFVVQLHIVKFCFFSDVFNTFGLKFHVPIIFENQNRLKMHRVVKQVSSRYRSNWISMLCAQYFFDHNCQRFRHNFVYRITSNQQSVNVFYKGWTSTIVIFQSCVPIA